MKINFNIFKKDNIEIKKGLEQFVLTLLRKKWPTKKKAASIRL